MNSSWRDEIGAVFMKEMRTELRAKSGFLTAGLFSVITVVAIAFASFGIQLTGQIAAGLLWVGLIFAGVVSLPRAFVAEEEQGTGDLLRLMARPHAVFWGKALFNLLQMLLTALLLSTLFLILTDLAVQVVWLYLLSLLFGCVALAGAVTFCGALVAQGANRAALAGAVSLPMLLPLVAVCVGATRVALGSGLMEGGVQALVGIACYGIALFAVGPYLFAAVWKS